ncbi:hypothetical protein L3Y34_011389 [Caenorhabditis briggsae]|uniref:RSD-2 N-terminal domain-containing protein n=1 Tax=Caenorhabditis briggsae TaxID=6238 RepID=A0AAE9CTW1_CAEBR|nr:hypothetical protein L3Y34_011389 [Caenorhabditis briggsae]
MVWYPPGGILLICTYPERNGICGYVNNCVAINESFSAHTRCFRFMCQCGRQFLEQVSVGDHQRKCDMFDCNSLTTTQTQEEDHRSKRVTASELIQFTDYDYSDEDGMSLHTPVPKPSMTGFSVESSHPTYSKNKAFAGVYGHVKVDGNNAAQM